MKPDCSDPVSQWIISLMCSQQTPLINGLTSTKHEDQIYRYHVLSQSPGHCYLPTTTRPSQLSSTSSSMSKLSTTFLSSLSPLNAAIIFQLILLIICIPWINCDTNQTNVIAPSHHTFPHHHNHHHHHQPNPHSNHVNHVSARIINRRESTKQGCPKKCECIWRGGKYEVDCKGLTFTKIPTEIHSDTQVINFNGNRIKSLEPKIFQNYGLINLQKIYLSNCSLKKIPGDSFASLSNLVELDLSSNYLETIPTEALKDSRYLRRLHLNSNPIKKIDSSSFVHLSSLQFLDLSNCAISSIHKDSFLGLEKLNYLFLNGNKLRELSGDILNSLISLKQIDLHENHWFCDCRILDLRSGIVDRSISITVPPICDKPIRLKGASWQSLDQDEFACNPKIASLNGAKFIEGRNGTIVCRVQSTPLSNISWYFESPVAANHLIKNATYMSFGKQYITIREILKDNVQISKLTITNTIEKDAGRYTCYAANKAGNVSSSVIIRVIQPENTGEESLVLSEKDEQVGIILATILVFLLLVLSACFIVLRHKTSFLSSIFKSSRGQSEVIESNVILDSAYLNHNSKSPIAINDNEHDQKRYIPHQSTKYSTGTTATVLGAKDTIVITQPNGSAGITSDTLVKVFQPNQPLTVVNNSPNNTNTNNTNKSLDESGFEKCLESYLMVSEDESMLLPSRTNNEVRYDPIIQQNDQQLTQQEQQLVNNWGQDAYDQAVYSTRSLNRRYSDSSATLMVKQLNVNSSGVNNSRVTIRDDSLELLPRTDNQNHQTTTNERFRSRRLSEGVISGRINSLWNRNNVKHSNQPLSSTNNIYPNEDFNNWTVGDSGQVVVNGDSNYFKGNFIGSEKESLLRRNGFTNVDYSTLQAPRRCSKSGLSSQFNNTPTSNYLRALSLEDSLNPTFPVIHESSKEYESDFKN